MSAKLFKAGQAPTLNPFSPPSLATTNRPVQYAPPPGHPLGHPLGHPAGKPPAQAPGSASSPAAAEPAKVKPPEPPDQVQELLAAASAKAESLVRTARAEAARLLSEAQTHVAAIEAAARERGLAEAHAVAHVQAEQELQLAVVALRDQLTSTLDKLAGLRAHMAAQSEQDMLRLALEIAKKVVQREVHVDHEIALTLARVALARLHSRTNAIVRLHPDDYAYVWSHRERLSNEASVEIIEDRLVGLGGCIVQSELGEIDSRIEQQFAEIEREFLSV